MRHAVLLVLLLLVGGASAIMIPLSDVTVNGTVFADLNANGIRDSGELGLQYIQIKVVDENGTEVGHTTTRETGYYFGTASCNHGIKLWVTAVAPDGMTHTRDESYEFSCIDGTNIYSLFGLSGTNCAWDYDCRAEEYCSSGLCRPLMCGEGYYAHNHECIPEPECRTPADCGPEETCSGLVCVPLSCAGLEGYEIVNHKCYPVEEEVPEEVPGCTVNDDCAFDEMCSEGSCVKVVCPEGFKVANHYCLYAPEEKLPEEEVPPEKNVSEEVPEEKPPAEPEKNVTVEVPKEEAPAPQEGIPDMVLVALIIAVAAVAITYMLVGRKRAA